ncbi:MAG: beta strand repeat-containing protein, partial [Kiritimatiellia bacterium]
TGGASNDVVYTVATNAGGAFNINGFQNVILDHGDHASVKVVYGNASDGGLLFNRSHQSVLGITATVNNYTDLGGIEQFVVEGGATRVPMAHGVVHPYLFSYRGGGSWNPTFLGYNETNGFVAPAYDVTSVDGLYDSVITNSALLNNITAPFSLTNDVSVHALEFQQTVRMELGDDVTLHIGDPAVGYSGLNLFNNSITQSVGTAGGKIAFGTNEAVILVGSVGGSMLALEGSGGLTLAGASPSGTLTLLDNNALSGPVAVHKAKLYAGNGGTTGDLGTTDSITVNKGGQVFFNRSDSVSWTGSITGDGEVGHAGTGTLDLTLTGANTLGSILNTNTGTLNLTLDSANTFGLILNTSSGVLNLAGADGYTNELTGIVPLRSSNDGAMRITGGTWKTPALGSNGGDTQWRGAVLISNATVVVSSSGRYMHGQTVVDRGGSLIANDRISLGESSLTADNPTITIHPGGHVAIVNNAYGLVIGASTPAHAGSDVGIIQNGGLVDLSTDSNTDLTLGQNLASRAYYQLAGGVLKVFRNIQGNATATATNHFDFADGSLFFGTFNATHISKTGGSKGIFVNSGGRLTPGDTNTAGRMIITGNYEVDNSAAALDVEIGGTLQANATQTGTNYYDFVSVTQNAMLNGVISASLIDGFVPASGAVFTVMSAGTLDGAFVNAPASGSTIPALAGASTSGVFVVTYTNDQVRLTYEPASAPALTLFEQWQIQYFGGTNAVSGGVNDDYDGDGLTNGDEFTAGTVPTNAASVLAISALAITNGDVAVTWTTSGGDPSGSFGIGKTNILEAATGYDGQFTNLIATRVIATPGDMLTNAVHAGGGSAEGQYYRIRVLP